MVRLETKVPARGATWIGHSGRLYPLTPARLESFSLSDDAIHLLLRGPLLLWAGSAADVVGDPGCRARFRLALDCADRVCRMAGVPDEIERRAILWDIEGIASDDARAAA